MSRLSTKSIRNALTTMRGALAVRDFARVRNAARYALSMLCCPETMPAKVAWESVDAWELVIQIIDLRCQKREMERARQRALFARNAA